MNRKERKRLERKMKRNEKILPPLGVFEDPPYQAQETESWKLAKGGPNEARGWFSGITPLPDGIWILKRGETTWMSNSPLERESQYLPILAATGNVVVGGLGMGWVAWNMAIKTDVERVIVIEMDNELADAFPTMLGMKSEDELPFEIYRGNALTTTIDDLGLQHVDLLYMDIWPNINQTEAPEDTKTAYGNIPADKVFWWTQELEIADFAGEKRDTHPGNPYVTVTKKDVKDYIKHIGLPLSGLELVDNFNVLVERARYHTNMTGLELTAGIQLEENGYPRIVQLGENGEYVFRKGNEFHRIVKDY